MLTENEVKLITVLTETISQERINTRGFSQKRFELMREVSEIDKQLAHLESLEKLRVALQYKCDHNWVKTGHDQYDDFYDCTICGAEETR